MTFSREAEIHDGDDEDDGDDSDNDDDSQTTWHIPECLSPGAGADPGECCVTQKITFFLSLKRMSLHTHAGRAISFP